MTIEEYNRLNLVYNARAEQQVYEESKNLRENADEIVAKYRREQLRIIRSEDIEEEIKEKEIERESYQEYEEPPETSSAQPYGKWKTIVKKYGFSLHFSCDIFIRFNMIENYIFNFFFNREEKPVDFQLPNTASKEFTYVPATTTETEPPPRIFKEKTVKSLEDEDNSIPNTFKKRKFGGNKRNARQRFDDDE